MESSEWPETELILDRILAQWGDMNIREAMRAAYAAGLEEGQQQARTQYEPRIQNEYGFN